MYRLIAKIKTMKYVVIFNTEFCPNERSFTAGYFLVESEEIFKSFKAIIEDALQKRYGVQNINMILIGVDAAPRHWEIINDFNDSTLHLEEADYEEINGFNIGDFPTPDIDLERVNYANYWGCYEIDGSGSGRHLQL